MFSWLKWRMSLVSLRALLASVAFEKTFSIFLIATFLWFARSLAELKKGDDERGRGKGSVCR